MLKSRADRRHRHRQELRARAVPALRRAVSRCRRARARRDRAREPKRRRRSPRGSARTCSTPTAPSIARSSAPIVFADAAARRDLEAIVHPAVYRAIAAGLRAFELIERLAARGRRHPTAVRDRARRRDFDRVIATVCPPATQLARLRGARPDRRARHASGWRRRCRPTRKRPAPTSSSRRTATFAETDAQVDAIWRQLEAEVGRSQDALGFDFSRDPAPARSALRRTCSSRGSADTARAARCCGSGSACRRAGRDRRRRARSARRSDRRATAGCRSWPSARQIA